MEEKEKKELKSDEVLDPDDFDDDEEDVKGDDEPDKDDTPSEKEPSKSDKSADDEDEQKQKEEKAKKERDSHFAELRRQKEAKEKEAKISREQEERERKIREEAKLEAELGILKENPYTGEKIVDAEDLKIYKLQKELDDEGKDPINDLPKRIAENARKAAKEAQERAEKEQKEKLELNTKINTEITELQNKYPKVNLSELAKDELFKECLNGRAGRWTQVEIYELYLQKKAEAEQKAKDDKTKGIVEEGGKKISQTPTSTTNGKRTSKKVEDMTDEEYEAYFAEKYGAQPRKKELVYGSSQ